MPAKIIWLASYPKSGNTWMRIFLTNYMRDRDAPADINSSMEGGPIASSRVWFDEWAGVEASSLPENIIERLRPEVYRCIARENEGILFLKAHDAWNLTDSREPLFPPEITAGVLYIVRNPLDLVASCAHHWGISLEKATDNLCDSSFVLARGGYALADQLTQRLGSWSDHVRSWLSQSTTPVSVTRYEDLLADPQSTFESVVKFCGLPFDPEKLSQAIAFSDISELKRQEQANGFRERPPTSKGVFFRRGQANSWRDELPPDLARRIVSVHGDMMQSLGYMCNGI